MLNLPANVRIYLCTAPTDMRKSFDGLHALVRQVFEVDPLDGHLFLFVNRRRDRVKILWWDRDGLALWYKRLEAGTYEVIDATALALLLSGVELQSAKRRKRYLRVA